MQVISANNAYASGFQRLVAFIIDRVAFGTILSLFIWTFNWGPFSFHHRIFGFTWHGPRDILCEILFLLYFALMESSPYQATLGKIVMRIKVVDKNNLRANFGTALLRNLSKILSALILGIGYIMIIFDERKQGLHDKVADTFVVEN